MSEMEKFMMQMTVNLGRVVLMSMFLPLGFVGGCPAKSKVSPKQR
jgi:hypothetical protein